MTGCVLVNFVLLRGSEAGRGRVRDCCPSY